MITVIIPTIFKCPEVTKKLLSSLVKDPIVKEIIIINNCDVHIENNNNKVRIIKPENNLFVNPSWNLGIKESETDTVALFNDDLIVCNNFLSKIFPLINDQTGIIGADVNHTQKTYSLNDFNNYPDEKEVVLKPVDKRTYAFGIIMIGRKASFCEIPDDFKIWCGDDMYVEYNIKKGRQNYVIEGPMIKHMESLSSNDPKFYNIKQKDRNVYEGKIKK